MPQPGEHPSLPGLAAREIHVTVKFRRRTDVFECTVPTVRIPCRADGPTVADHEMGKRLPLVFRDDLHQIVLDGFGTLLLGESQAAGESLDVRIDDDPLDNVVTVLEDDVRGLPADTWKVSQRVHGVRNLAVVLFDEDLADPFEVAGLVVVKRDAVNVLGELFLVGGGVVFRRLVCLKEFGRRFVNALVGTLCRKDDRHQQFQSVREGERNCGIGVGVVHSFDDFRGLC